MMEKLLSFTMILTRLSAFFLSLPVFGWKTIPVQIKVAMTLLISIFFTAIKPISIDLKDVSVTKAILLISNEATYGLALGLIVVFIFSVVKFSGRVVERQMGLAMANILDPLTDESAQPLGSLLEMIFVIIFLSANGHHLFLLIISKSYDAFPVGTIPTIQVLTNGTVQASSIMFIAGLRLAAPMLAVFLLLMIVLAILARIVPEMNILFISFPLRIGLGLLMAAAFLPFINSFIAEFADWMGKLLPL